MKPSISESDFSEQAVKTFDSFFETLKEARGIPLIGGISLFEPNTAPLLLYYLRKGLRLEAIGASVSNGHRKRRKTLFLRAAWFLREMGYALGGSLQSVLPSADILFVCNVVRQHDAIAPVIKKLAGHKTRCLVVSKPPIPIPGRFNDPLVTYHDWSTLRSFAYWGDLLEKSRSWKHFWDGELRNHLPHRGGNMIEQWFEDKYLQSTRALLLAERAVSSSSPKVIVVTDPADAEAKAFSLVGQRQGIPSFCVQYGMAGPHDSEWHYFAQDYAGVLDTEAARVIEKLGVSPSRILVTGNPRYDSYEYNDILRDQLRQQLNVPRSHPLIAFLSIPPSPERLGKMESYISVKEHRELVQTVCQLATGPTNHILLIKPHPEEPIDAYRDAVSGLGDCSEKIRLVREHNSYQIINAADLVITAYSTTGLEAIYLDKPLMTINLTGRPDHDNYASSGAALSVRHAGELKNGINDLLSDSATASRLKEGRKRYIGRNPYFANGRTSAERCVEVILALKEGKSPERERQKK